MKPDTHPLTTKRVFYFWVPLAATWLMMATEGPILAAIIARLADPKQNLAAYGVAFSFAVLIEAPIIMIMSASTALVKDRDSFIKLRNFTYSLNIIITVVMILFLIPPIFNLFTQKIIGLPENIARLTHRATLFMLPWPAAIGYRRFYQGILISRNLTRRVAYGTIVRLSMITLTSTACYLFSELPGAVVGGLSLSLAVSAEAVASKLMTRGSIDKLNNLTEEKDPEETLTYRSINRFYYPLALTALLSLGIYPLITFFMGHSRMALESLAALPVINSLVFVFRSLGLSYQEVGIALLGSKNHHFDLLKRFAFYLGLGVALGLALLAFTPLSLIWFQKISGLSLELSLFSILPLRLMFLLPALTVLISFQRAILVANKRTGPITLATCLEVASIFVILFLTIHVFDFIGAVAAGIAMILGRLLANLYLIFPCRTALRGRPKLLSSKSQEYS